MKLFQKLLLLSAFTLIIGLTGCKENPQASNAEDSSNPFFKQASEFESQQSYVAAIEEYTKALAANPALAKAHLNMAAIYNEKLSDPVSAIYHYQQYLKIRPDATDYDEVRACIDKCKIDFALSLPNTPLQNADEVARLTRENLELKHTITDLQQQLSGMQAGVPSGTLSTQGKDAEIARLNQELAQVKQALMDAEAKKSEVKMLANASVVPLSASENGSAGSLNPTSTAANSTDSSTSSNASGANSTATPSSTSESSVQTPTNSNSSAPSQTTQTISPAESSAQTSQAPSATESNSASQETQAEPRKHVIVKGDTLWNIASRYYPGEVAEGVKKIKAANKQATAKERNLKLGQTLIIP